MRERQLYLDCDGVLADFDHGAERVLGVPLPVYEARHGRAHLWERLAQAPEFFFHLPLMPRATELFAAVRHLHPIILTGLPRGNWAAGQKVRWAERHFPGTKIITCLAVDKRKHCADGDVLVDDTLKYRHLWEQAGGIFIHFRDVDQVLQELAGLFPAIRSAAQGGTPVRPGSREDPVKEISHPWSDGAACGRLFPTCKVASSSPGKPRP
ncbi:5' nucleotidase, NT5C type [Ramlibacter alkalitolerans]|uniref:5'-nucleotidase n=1 Tax=Ramlibacter alkalitolerans TaxID=2039631 RepID=A0ABS1JQE4_9BURK|nr:hypothetical protein [Ramlibacter alkalitolerans]MBL0426485.1 hypothetical protein [Ramlibacter alkalitolerans]